MPLREPLQPSHHLSAGDPAGEIVIPDIAVAYSPKHWIPMEALQVFVKVRLLGIDVADHPYHDVVGVGDLQRPQIVLDPVARLHMDRAHDAERLRPTPIRSGKRAADRGGRSGYECRRALRTVGIEEVYMRIDDRHASIGAGRSRIDRNRDAQSGRTSLDHCPTVHLPVTLACWWPYGRSWSAA